MRPHSVVGLYMRPPQGNWKIDANKSNSSSAGERVSFSRIKLTIVSRSLAA